VDHAGPRTRHGPERSAGWPSFADPDLQAHLPADDREPQNPGSVCRDAALAMDDFVDPPGWNAQFLGWLVRLSTSLGLSSG